MITTKISYKNSAVNKIKKKNGNKKTEAIASVSIIDGRSRRQ